MDPAPPFYCPPLRILSLPNATMNLFIEEPRPQVDRPDERGWLGAGAIQYLGAVLKDLKKLDPELQCEDAQRLVLRIWHLVDSAQGKGRLGREVNVSVKRGFQTEFERLPSKAREQTRMPGETTLELLVRTLACTLGEGEQLESLCAATNSQKAKRLTMILADDYRHHLNNKLRNVIETYQSLAKQGTKKMCGMPNILFICIGPHRRADRPVHIITTNREHYSQDPDGNHLDKWAQTTFRARLTMMSDKAEFNKVLKASEAFYETVFPKGWEERLNRPYSGLNAEKALQHLAKKTITSDTLPMPRKVNKLLKFSHMANETAAWIAQSSISALTRIFDHSAETAVAFRIDTKSHEFDFRTRCFRCRGLFHYRQIPHAIKSESDFPFCWDDEIYGIYCAEVPGHFLCLAASRAGSTTSAIR